MATNKVSPKKGKVVDIPTVPTIGTATAGPLSASVAFTASTKGGPVSSYTVISSPGSITATGTSSPISVTGLTVGTTYTFTIRANNVTGSSEYSSASNSAVPTSYSVGDTLPNGGTIFYDAGSTLSWGRYIAAAPQSWDGGSDPNINWSNVQNDITTNTGIGTGGNNTTAMIADNSNVAFAGGKCRAYTAGGSTWSLPSRDELSAIVGTSVTMQSNVYYWSSSQFGGSAFANMVYFQSGTVQFTTKGTNERVRPICYFTP